MKLKARTKRLEKKRGIGLPCAQCRLNAGEELKARRRQLDAVVLRSICSICGDTRKILFEMEGESDFEREVSRNLQEMSLKDCWFDVRRSAMRHWYKLKSSLGEHLPAVNDQNPPQYVKPVGEAAKLRARLEAQAERELSCFVARMKAMHGLPFPQHAVILKAALGKRAADTAEYISAEEWDEQELAKLEAIVKFEMIIWGTVLADTRAELKRIKQGKLERKQNAHREESERRQREEAAKREEEARAAEERRLQAEEAAKEAARLEQEALSKSLWNSSSRTNSSEDSLPRFKLSPRPPQHRKYRNR